MVENKDHSIPETTTRTKRGKNSQNTQHFSQISQNTFFTALTGGINVDLLL